MTIRRTSGQPAAADVQFTADPAADYLLQLHLTSGRGGPVTVSWNGQRSTTQALSAENPLLSISLPVLEQNSLRVSVAGSPDWSLDLRVHEGARLIGPSGGIVGGRGGLARIEFPPNTVSGSLVAQIGMAADREATTLRTSGVHRLIIPVRGPGFELAPAGAVSVTVPLSVAPAAGTTSLFSILPDGQAGPLWAYPDVVSPENAALVLAVSELQLLAEALDQQVLDLSWQVEEFQSVFSPPAGAAGSAQLSTDAFTLAVAPRVSCQPLPPGAAPPTYVPCDQPLLSRVGTVDVSPVGGTALVLVHGWHFQVGDWISYYAKQGINCHYFIPLGCYVDPFLGRDLPGVVYWGSAYIRQLQSDFPDLPIYLYDYESHNHYHTTGRDLATALLAKQASKGFADAILIGHSMGGLVSRTAAIDLAGRNRGDLIRGVITLGSPHDGTPLVTNPIAKLLPGIPTEGGQSLGTSFPRSEQTPLFAFAGNINGFPKRPEYALTYSFLRRHDPNNDGVVPVASATPQAFTGPEVTLHPENAGYDHSHLFEGRGPLPGDPVYQQVVADICELLSCRTDHIFVMKKNSCAFRASGEVWCWGENAGIFGNGAREGTCYGQPACGPPTRGGGGLRFAALDLAASASDGDHVCGIELQGSAYCWGSNGQGQLGDGSLVGESLSPVRVAGNLTFVVIEAGDTHSCGIAANGVTYCWGANHRGQLGDGTLTDRRTPDPVVGGSTLKLKALASGDNFTCGLDLQGAAYCWGQGNWGQLGTGERADRMVPTRVAGNTTFRQIAAFDSHVCTIDEGGAPYCWGTSAGTGSDVIRLVPTVVSTDLKFETISAGELHSCGVAVGGGGYCWGRNQDGQLGTGDTSNSLRPVAVAGQLVFRSIAAGEEHSCGVTISGEYYCWGHNRDGQVGNAIFKDETTLAPVRVNVP